jgi:hypothetical protein
VLSSSFEEDKKMEMEIFYNLAHLISHYTLILGVSVAKLLMSPASNHLPLTAVVWESCEEVEDW